MKITNEILEKEQGKLAQLSFELGREQGRDRSVSPLHLMAVVNSLSICIGALSNLIQKNGPN